MNPVSLYYCFDAREASGSRQLLPSTNTPWRRAAIVTCSTRATSPVQGSMTPGHPKRFHVSPFLDDGSSKYRWRICVLRRATDPGIDCWTCRRTPVPGRTIAASPAAYALRLVGPLLRYPAMTLQVCLWIYWQAFHLAKGRAVRPHPRHCRCAHPVHNSTLNLRFNVLLILPRKQHMQKAPAIHVTTPANPCRRNRPRLLDRLACVGWRSRQLRRVAGGDHRHSPGRARRVSRFGMEAPYTPWCGAQSPLLSSTVALAGVWGQLPCRSFVESGSAMI